MNIKAFLVLVVTIKHVFAGLSAYKSTLSITDPNPDAGLRLVRNATKKETDFTDGLAFCGRFNYRRLSTDSVLFQFESMNLWTWMGYDQTFLFFSQYNWIVRDVHKNSFSIWTAQRWHHICLSFDRNTSHLLFIKVGWDLLHSWFDLVLCL